MNYDTNPMPLYHQAYEIFLNKITSKQWPENSKIPREADLCTEIGMSRITVRQALERLKNEGYLTSRQGKGTFVQTRRMEKKLNAFYSFSDEIADGDLIPRSVLLSFLIVTPPQNVAQKLRLNGGEEVFQIERLRCMGEVPFAYETSYVPARLVPGLTAEEIQSKGLYNSMRDLSSRDPDGATETFCAVPIAAEIAKRLNCPPNSPALQIERLATSRGTLVEYCRSIVKGDRICYQVALSK